MGGHWEKISDRFLLVYMQTYRTTSGKYSQVHHGVPLEVGGGKGRKEAAGGGGAASSSIIPCVVVRLIDYVMVCTLCSFPFQTWYHPRSAYFLCSKYHQGFGPTRPTVKQHTNGWMHGWMDEISIQLDCG